MTYVAKFPFVALVRIGHYPSRVEALMDAAKRFGPDVRWVRSEADYQEEIEEQQALKRMRRRTDD